MTVTQRTPYDCSVCCLAMLTGREYDDVLSSIGDVFDPARGMRYEHDALRRLGFTDTFENGEPVGDFHVRVRGILAPEFFRAFAWDRRALMTVPSINYDSAFHMIFWDGTAIHDPSSAKRYERWDQLLPDELVLFRNSARSAMSDKEAEARAYERAATIAREYAGKANSEQGRVVATGIAFAISALSNPDAANREKAG